MSNGGIELTYSKNVKRPNAQNWGITETNKLDIANEPFRPSLWTDCLITNDFVNELIIYKKSLLPTGTPWDGSFYC